MSVSENGATSLGKRGPRSGWEGFGLAMATGPVISAIEEIDPASCPAAVKPSCMGGGRGKSEGGSMSSITITLIVFAGVFGGAIFGMLVRAALPEHHLSDESENIVKLGVGLVGTMAALVLGLLLASAKSSYDTQCNELTEVSAKVIYLDRMLAHYGPETKEARELLRKVVAGAIDRLWSADREKKSPSAASSAAEALYGKIVSLSPKDDAQRSVQAHALSILSGLGETRWLMYAQGIASVPMPLLVVLSFWLAVIFISFGLFAPSNATVIASLFVSALSVSGAIFLILEFYAPYTGILQISSAPMRAALAHLGQ